MNKKISIGVTISLVFIAAAITFILTSAISLSNFNQKIKDVKERSEKYTNFEEYDTIIRANYNGTIDETKLLDSIFEGYLEGLDDKYAYYYKADEYNVQQLQDEGKLLGIGISVQPVDNGYIKIVDVTSDSPASSAGLQPQDIIVAVNGIDVVEAGYNEAITMIKSGDETTAVSITIRREGEEKIYEILRQTMEIVTVDGKILNNNIGYIHISGFNKATPEQFKTLLQSLISNGATGLIFDVRNNSGGLVSSTGDILDPLIGEGDIAIATYNDGKQTTIITSDAEKTDLPMVVLVNSNSASGAELFACALRDFANAKLVGTKTYGKGVMQNTFSLSNGGAVKFTTATYQTTVSECFDGVGLTPDFEVTLSEEAQENIFSLDVSDDPQLLKAIEVIDAITK